MKILKFGGSSLDNGKGLQNCLEIIEKAAVEPIVIVVSARGDSTDVLENLLERAAGGETYTELLNDFFSYQLKPARELVFDEEKRILGELLHAVSLTREYSQALKDRVLAYGELLSARTVNHLLQRRGLKTLFVDSRELLVTHVNGSRQVMHNESEKRVSRFFEKLPQDTVPVITGFIAAICHFCAPKILSQR